MHTY
jgi:SWI/SNF-related matrix-associated actin-dependent regulator of chromatin subfamily A protein 2/4